ncbi:MAG TPA: hypothetical protein VFK02_02820 [Kofleriaceae bacterium]|nr:hypothetical protein [Kofleriaceae bacterium]
MPTDTIETIDPEALARVSGGATSNDQLTAVLTQITSSISDLAKANQNQTDPTMMMMMMMMMGGFGGGGGGAYVAAPAPGSPPVINVDTSVAGGGRGLPFFGGGGRGGCGSKKGW